MAGISVGPVVERVVLSQIAGVLAAFRQRVERSMAELESRSKALQSIGPFTQHRVAAVRCLLDADVSLLDAFERAVHSAVQKLKPPPTEGQPAAQP